jgi:protein-tyrosine-phosphatase/predicted ATP-grasp superfamily ATP-dependent carboligase
MQGVQKLMYRKSEVVEGVYAAKAPTGYVEDIPLVKRRRVLVLGTDTRAFLATIRSLGRSGLEVHVAWCPPDAPALQSRYVKQVHRVPLYCEDTSDWIESFQNLLRRQQFDLVLPIIDTAILPLQLHRSEFEPLARFCLLPDDTYRLCSDKVETYKLAAREGIPLPRHRVVRNVGEALECAKEFGYPLVLKPRKSVMNQNPNVRQMVRKAPTELELCELAKQMTRNQEVLAVENFIGSGVGVEVLCKDGQILTAFQHERIHEPMMGGGSSYRKSVPLHDGMYAATTRLMKALRYSGVAMVEYKQNSSTGEWILIEINARFWGSLPLSISAGLDFPRYLYEMLVEGRTVFPEAYRVGVFSRNWQDDIEWILANRRADRNDPTLLSRPFWSVMIEIGNILRLRESSDTLALDDPRPAWTDLAQYFEEMVFRVLKMFRLYRWIEHRRLVRLYRSARGVIVLCYGNICRSPFAEKLLDQVVTNKVVASAGTHLTTGRKSPPESTEAATAFGVDLLNHRSRVVTSEQLESADLIIVFDRRNWLAVRSMCPEVMARVAYLGAADTTEPLEIQDPFGNGIEQFHACYNRVRHLVEQLARSVNA